MTGVPSGEEVGGAPTGLAEQRGRLHALWRAAEPDCINALVPAAVLSQAQEARVRPLAERLSTAARRGGREALLQRLALDSAGGLALLALAEALLRIPDCGNADRLIRDQLRLRQWMMPVLRPGLRQAMRLLGGQFIFAPRIETGLARARHVRPDATSYSFDMLGEAALTGPDANRYFAAYQHAIHAVGQARAHGAPSDWSVSVKLSALHPRYGYTQRGRVMAELAPRLHELARLAQRHGMALSIDAEEAERLELSLDLIEALAGDAALGDWQGLGVAVQAYQKRAPAVIDYLAALAARRARPIAVRLVKGAYWDMEIKLTQQQGLRDYPLYTRKVHTDVAFRACAHRLLAAWPHLRAQFATHNARSVAEVLELASGSEAQFEFQRLFGMGRSLYRALASTPQLARPVRVYAPIGDHATLLPYLMRRLLENGAGNSFVHRAARAPPDLLSADPLAAVLRSGGAPHARIPLPAQLFAPRRRNSTGLDLEDPAVHTLLRQALESSRRAAIEVCPLLSAAATARADEADRHGASRAGPTRPIRSPADRSELIGAVREADASDVRAALHAAQAGARDWARTAVETRARLLERAADLYEQRAGALIALIVREAGRTLACAIGELREAVDALHYYAAQIRAEFAQSSHVPLGVVACISPWNFPLAIFTGQIAAALAAGNVVIAKPAEQTAATAALALQLLREAGIDVQVLQLLPGGARVGLQLVSDPGVQGVVFTGSTATARVIARALAPRGPVPLIAETGGQNAMIVDSSALPEQVVSDVLRSAFDSAGQRCSSLRVLCLQREIADATLAMLEGAMRELRVGDPAELATDVGPLIDEAAHERVSAHLERFAGRVRCRSPLPATSLRGIFLPPTLLELERIGELSAEVFGPVLHVVRFDRRQLDRLLDDIHATGYGLTLGIASRIQSTVDYIIERAHIGNVYVNRNMIGAVIGVQPFGGQGLSGTGPKAGGPLYLHAMLAHTPGPVLQAQLDRHTPATLQMLIDWLQQGGGPLRAHERERVRLRAERYAQRSPLGVRLALPGYSGESNELRLRSRGALRATGRAPAPLLEQLAAALATGNTLQIDEPRAAAALHAILPPALQALARAAAGPCAGVLMDGLEAQTQPERVRQWCVELAAGEGAIVPLIVADPTEGYALERLLLEQCVSVNTAAVGGDAQLLALADE